MILKIYEGSSEEKAYIEDAWPSWPAPGVIWAPDTFPIIGAKLLKEDWKIKPDKEQRVTEGNTSVLRVPWPLR